MKLNLLHTLLPISAILVILSFIFRGQQTLQIRLIIAGILSYLVISLLHHKRDKSLTTTTILEYILLAVLAAIVLGTLIF